MDKLEEYRKLALLASNFAQHRPTHLINALQKPLLARFARVFERNDDDALGIAPNARAVGAARARAPSETLLVVI